MNHAPCPTCPWRKSSTVGGFDIPGFNICMMRGLRNTVPALGEERDAFRPMMACHYSEPDEETPCRGYVAVEGYTNLSVRLSAMRGAIPMGEIMEACRDLELWCTFAEMLAAYEEAVDANKR